MYYTLLSGKLHSVEVNLESTYKVLFHVKLFYVNSQIRYDSWVTAYLFFSTHKLLYLDYLITYHNTNAVSPVRLTESSCTLNITLFLTQLYCFCCYLSTKWKV